VKEKRKACKRNGSGASLWKIAGIGGVLLIVAALGLPGELAASGEGGEHGRPGFGWAVVFQIINFTLLVSLFVYVYRKKSSGAFEKRSLEVQSEMESAQEAKQQAEAKFNEYKKRIDQLDVEIKKIRDMAAEDAEREKTSILEAAQKQSEKLVKQAELTAAQEVEQARRQLRKEAAELAAGMAEEVIKKAVTAEDQKSWVNAYIEKIGELR